MCGSRMTAEAIDQRRLDFSKLKHCGRDSELQELHHLLEGATSADGAETVAVLMHGDSGTGKSALLANFLDVASHCWVLRGKFEERAAASEPFAALMEAIDDLVQYMIAEDRDVWAERLRKALDTELELICGILTCLRFLFSSGTSSNKDEVTSQQEDFIEDDSVNSDPFGDMTRREFRFERFKYAFRCLLRCVCTHKPVVLALDDFHSVDPDSLEILKTLLSDSKRKSNFLFVGASRPMADYESLRSFSESLSKERLRLAVISGLSLSDISSLLNDLLQRDGDSVRQLAEVIESKTNGNAFVVLQFLRMLERDCHIFFSGDSLRWEWDIDTILQVENISESVTEVLTQNLERVDKRRKSALMVAASLGTSQFDVSTIVHAASVLEDEGDAACTDSLDTDRMDPITVRQTIEQMNADLTEAEKDGFVQMIEKGSFRFAHDRIRESAYSLIPDGNGREEVHLRVGRQLRSWMDTGSELGLVQGFSEQSLLLHAAKQLNLGSAMIVDDWEKLDLVELNYRAAELSAEKASFYTSMEYLKKGLAHLGKSAWKSHYDWTLKLCVALTRMQYSCGLVEQCMETADDVIENGNSFRDKRAVYHTKIFCLIQQQRMKEATNLALSVLESLGYVFPKRFLTFHVLIDVIKTKRLMKNVSPEDVLRLPAARAEDTTDCSEFGERLAEISAFSNNTAYFVLVCLLQTRILMAKGRFPRCFLTVCVWAFLKVRHLNEFEEGLQFGTLASQMAAKQRNCCPQAVARNDALCWLFFFHWTVPLRKGLVPLSKSFDYSWKAGGAVQVHMDKHVLLRLMFVCGEPLEDLARVCCQFSESLLDYHHTLHWHGNAPIYQAALNFQGLASDPVILNGEHMNLKACKAEWKRTDNRPAELQYAFYTLLLAYHFHDLEMAQDMIKQVSRYCEADASQIGSFMEPTRFLYTGLVYTALFKNTRKRKYLRKARSARRELKRISDKGAVNSIYAHLLLEAEVLSCSRKPNLDSVLKAYDRSILAVTQLEFWHHCGLANELAGSFLASLSDSKGARLYLTRAVEQYRKWGATAVVDDVTSRFAALQIDSTDATDVP